MSPLIDSVSQFFLSFVTYIKELYYNLSPSPLQIGIIFLPMIINFFELIISLNKSPPNPFPERDYKCEVFEIKHENNELNKGEPMQNKSKKKMKTFVKILLSIVVIVVLCIILYFNGLFGKLKTYNNDSFALDYNNDFIISDTDYVISTGTFNELIAEDTDDVEEIKITALDEFDESMLDIKAEDVMNILLIGSDTRENSYNDIGNTDSMILVSLNTKSKNVKLTSFMRDMYVTIPGHGKNRLNAAFAYGGPELLFETLKVNFDVDVDKYIVINFSNFKKLVDKVGGVDIELTKAEARYMNKYANKYHTDPVEEGLQTLNGTQALSYARCRKIDSDFNRTERQRKVIKAFVEKLKTCNAIQLNSLINDAFDMVYTNVSKLDVIGVFINCKSYMKHDIQTMNVPINNSCVDETINGMSVLSPNFTLNKKAIKAHIYSTYQLEV